MLPDRPSFLHRILVTGLVPLLTFGVLSLLTLWVWDRQVDQQRQLLQRHTDDICLQASRRIEAAVHSLLQVARVFSERWQNHETRDFSRQRFETFASVLLREMSGYHALYLLGSREQVPWRVPPGQKIDREVFLGIQDSRLFEETTASGGPIFSPPHRHADGPTCYLAAIPLFREKEPLGHFIVEIRARTLVDTAFEQRIRSEFHMVLYDGSVELARFNNPPDVGQLSRASISARRIFDVNGRRWTIAMVPRQAQLDRAGWRSALPVPLLGFPLSLGLGLLVFLLGKRMQLYREARDQAMQEVAERRRAQLALEASESRYRKVFNSATDALLILDENGVILEANLAAFTLHESEPEDLLGQPLSYYLAPGHGHLFDEMLRQIEQFGSARVDWMIRRKQGASLDAEVRGASFLYNGQRRLLAIITDVSDRKRAVYRHAQLSRKVLMAQEDERARVSRELHDELGQILTALHLELDMLHRKACKKPESAAAGFGAAIQMLERATEELRRICRGLRPPLLDDLGLEPATRVLVEEFEERRGHAVELDIRLDEGTSKLPVEVALCTYRVLQESLNNITRHAEARAVSIVLHRRPEELYLSVYDDGKGFDVNERSGSGCGIAGMRERAYLVNGTIDMRSEPLQGTRVVLRVPLEPVPRRESDDQGTRS